MVSRNKYRKPETINELSIRADFLLDRAKKFSDSRGEDARCPVKPEIILNFAQAAAEHCIINAGGRLERLQARLNDRENAYTNGELYDLAAEVYDKVSRKMGRPARHV